MKFSENVCPGTRRNVQTLVVIQHAVCILTFKRILSFVRQLFLLFYMSTRFRCGPGVPSTERGTFFPCARLLHRRLPWWRFTLFEGFCSFGFFLYCAILTFTQVKVLYNSTTEGNKGNVIQEDFPQNVNNTCSSPFFEECTCSSPSILLKLGCKFPGFLKIIAI